MVKTWLSRILVSLSVSGLVLVTTDTTGEKNNYHDESTYVLGV